MNQQQWEERLVHYQYIQELLRDRDVLEIGSGNGSGADFLAEFGRRVLVIDTQVQRVGRCRQSCAWSNVDCMVGEPDRLQVKSHSFDVVLVPELERWFTRGGLLPEIRRVLAQDGLVLFVVRSADRGGSGGSGMGYADLEEYLSQSFEHIRILGAIPFRGVTMADFEPEGELDPQLDCTLISEDEEPVSYLALCSRQSLVSPGYSVVQVPGGVDALGPRGGLSERVLGTVETWAETEGGVGQVALMTQLLDREMTRVAALEQRLEQARTNTEGLSGRCIEERGRAEVERVRADATERQLTDCRTAVEELRRRAEGAERRCDSLMTRIEQGAGELSTLHHRMAELQGLRQADQWHIDELVGKLRKSQQGGEAAEGVSTEDQLTKNLRPQRVGDKEIEEIRQRLEQTEARAIAAEQQGSAVEERARKAEKRATRAEQRLKELERHSEQQLQEKAELEKELMRSESRVTENARRATNSESKNVQMEVRLKRSESEAATLSKWAEELREELKTALGKSSAVPPTPEPEVAALRNELRQARERVGQLEDRCHTMLVEVEQSRAALSHKDQALQQALASVDADLFEEVRQLREQGAELEQLRQRLQQTEGELARVESQLRDSEQAETELKRTRREMGELQRSVRDIDGASEELEQLRLHAGRNRETKRELEQVRDELEQARIELTRCHEELRGVGAGLPEEAAWSEWEEEDEEEEQTGYVGPDMPVEEGEEEEAGWDIMERVQVQERQIEALLEGAAMHQAEMERQHAQVAEMDALIQELQYEQRELEKRLAQCGSGRELDQKVLRQLKEENTRLGRDLARVQGELRRCQEQQLRRVEATPDSAGSSGLQQDLDREVRARQKLQDDLERRLSELDELSQGLRTRDQALDRLRSEDTEHRAELRELRQQTRELERDSRACQEQLREREGRLAQLQAEAPAADRSESPDRDRLIERLQQQLSGSEEQIECLRQDLSRCRGGVASLENKLERAREQREERDRVLERVGAEQAHCEDQVHKLESQLDERKERIVQLQGQLEQKQQQLEQLRRTTAAEAT